MWTGRPLPLPGRGRRAAYGRGIDAYVMLLFVQLAQQIHQMENKPPVTLALMAGARAACECTTSLCIHAPSPWAHCTPSRPRAARRQLPAVADAARDGLAVEPWGPATPRGCCTRSGHR
jgi:hypothetical protein